MHEKTSQPWKWIALAFGVNAIVWVAVLLRQGWRPIGDEAAIAQISADIWHGFIPWLGMRSTGFAEVPGLQLYHPGPIQFFILSLGQAVTNLHPIGLLAASALLFFVVVLLGLRGAWQAAQWWGLIPATAVFVVLAYTSQDVLIQIINTQPSRAAIPAAIMTAWAVACGRKNAWLPFIFTATVAAQTQVAALPVILLLTATLVFLLWRNQVPAPERRTRLWAGLLFLVLWAGPILDIFVGQPSNFTEFMRYITTSSPTASPVTPEQRATGIALLLSVPLALLASWLITHRTTDRIRPGLGNTLAVGLQLSAPIVTFIGYQLMTQSSPARRVQAMFGMGAAYFMVFLTLLTLIAWTYQAYTKNEDEKYSFRAPAVGIGLLVLTVLAFTIAILVNEALLVLSVLILLSSLNSQDDKLSIGALRIPWYRTFAVSLAIGMIWILGFTSPQPSHLGSLETNPEVTRLVDTISDHINAADTELPVELRGSPHWNIGLYLAPTLQYELTSQGRTSYFTHPWTFEKDHKRPGIKTPKGERIIVILESPSGFEAATQDLEGEVLARETFDARILNDGEVIELLMIRKS